MINTLLAKSDKPDYNGTMTNPNTIRISENLQDLTGEGLEYYVKGDIVMARFWNGNFYVTYNLPTGNTEITKGVL